MLSACVELHADGSRASTWTVEALGFRIWRSKGTVAPGTTFVAPPPVRVVTTLTEGCIAVGRKTSWAALSPRAISGMESNAEVKGEAHRDRGDRGETHLNWGGGAGVQSKRRWIDEHRPTPNP